MFLAYYIPTFETEEVGVTFGIKEVDKVYFEDTNPLNFAPYLKDYLKILKKSDVITQWERVLKEIESKNGKCIHPIELFPLSPNKLFGLEGKEVWYLNTTDELIYIKDYTKFRILKNLKDNSTKLFKLDVKRPKKLLEYENEKEFQIAFEG